MSHKPFIYSKPHSSSWQHLFSSSCLNSSQAVSLHSVCSMYRVRLQIFCFPGEIRLQQHTQPFPSVPAEILASWNSNGSNGLHVAAHAAFPRSATLFLPLDFSNLQLAELKRFVRLIKLGRRYVEGVWSLFDKQLGFSSILSPNSCSTLLFNKIRCYVTARCNFH